MNPKENSLFRWRKDLTKALRRKEFYSRDYNHLFGRFSSSYKAKVADVVVSQGLHALYDSLDDGVDLKVYIEMENRLRINFKVNRDSSTRGQDKKIILNQIRKRQKDFRTYVEPQKNKADAYIYLSSSTRYADKVDMVELTFKQPHSAEFLFSALQSFVNKCQLLNDKRGFVKIRIYELEDISSFILTKFLQTHAPEMVAMSRKISNVESGSRGLIVAVLIVLWEYLRLEAYNENYS